MIESHHGRDLLLRCGAKVYESVHGAASTPNYNGPTLGDGRVVIRSSAYGGKGKRGLFAGAGGISPTDNILYSGEVIDATEAKARKRDGKADYIAQLGYRDDVERVE